MLHYSQQRFYAGNNGLLGLFTYGGAFTGAPFSDFLLDQVATKGRGSSTDPWTHLHNRVALYVQDDFKVVPALTLNLGMRWAYTQPVVEKDDRQSNFDLRTGQQILADDGSRETRALYRPIRKGSSRGSGSRTGPRKTGSSAAPTASRSNGGHWRQPPAAAEPAVLLRVVRAVQLDNRLRQARARLRRRQAARWPSGQVRAWDPNLRPQFTQQWNVFAEYLLTRSMSANVGYVGHKPTHLVTPVEGNQPLPGIGDCRPGRH